MSQTEMFSSPTASHVMGLVRPAPKNNSETTVKPLAASQTTRVDSRSPEEGEQRQSSANSPAMSIESPQMLSKEFIPPRPTLSSANEKIPVDLAIAEVGFPILNQIGLSLNSKV